MSPETTAGLSAVAVAAIAAGPAYLGIMARRMRRSAEHEGEATRDVVRHAVESASLATNARVDAARDESRHDVSELRKELCDLRHEVRDVRSWQASHSAITISSVDRTEHA